MTFWLVLKLEISYNRVIIISWRILVFFLGRGFFWRLYFCMVQYLSFRNPSFCLKIILKRKKKEKWQGHNVIHPPLFFLFFLGGMLGMFKSVLLANYCVLIWLSTPVINPIINNLHATSWILFIYNHLVIELSI
jgi:hypothetical protein